jgi:hypothetical protein
LDKKTQGKISRKQGKDFEKRVRKDLEKNWIVDRWTNQVEFNSQETKSDNLNGGNSSINLFETDSSPGKLIPAKPMFYFDVKSKRRIPLSTQTGFPDFIIFRNFPDFNTWDVEGVECKITGKLDKIEKQKCKWLLDNKIFSKIIIASKGEKGEINYVEFKD